MYPKVFGARASVPRGQAATLSAFAGRLSYVLSLSFGAGSGFIVRHHNVPFSLLVPGVSHCDWETACFVSGRSVGRVSRGFIAIH